MVPAAVNPAVHRSHPEHSNRELPNSREPLSNRELRNSRESHSSQAEHLRPEAASNQMLPPPVSPAIQEIPIVQHPAMNRIFPVRKMSRMTCLSR